MIIFESHSFDDLSKLHGEARLSSYLADANNDKNKAKDDYLKNIKQCQTFWRKIIFIEVAFRNKIMGEWEKIYNHNLNKYSISLKQDLENLTEKEFNDFEVFKNSLPFLKTKDKLDFNNFKSNPSNFINQSKYINHPLKDYFPCSLHKNMNLNKFKTKLEIIHFITKRIYKQNSDAQKRVSNFKNYGNYPSKYTKDVLISRLDINFWVKMFKYISIEFTHIIDIRFKRYSNNYSVLPYFIDGWFDIDLLKIQAIRNNIAHHENILKGRRFEFFNEITRTWDYETLGVKEIDDLLKLFCKEVVDWK